MKYLTFALVILSFNGQLAFAGNQGVSDECILDLEFDSIVPEVADEIHRNAELVLAEKGYSLNSYVFSPRNIQSDSDQKLILGLSMGIPDGSVDSATAQIKTPTVRGYGKYRLSFLASSLGSSHSNMIKAYQRALVKALKEIPYCN